MAETLEYLLVIAVTLTLAGAGVAMVDGAFPTVHTVQASSQFTQIVGAANTLYLDQGAPEAPLLMLLSNDSISCSQGIMSYVSGNLSYSAATDWPSCSFSFPHLDGFYQLLFYGASGTTLYLSATPVNGTGS